MKRRFGIIALALALVAGGAYVARGTIRDAWDALAAPRLPVAKPYQPGTGSNGGTATDPAPSPFEGGYASSQNYVLDSSPTVASKPKDPLVYVGTLPREVNLDVPFTTQAPHANWDEPYQNACEEASAYMVDEFYDRNTGKIPADVADAAIKKMVAWENATFGYYKDTTAEETARLLREYFGYKTVLVKPFDDANDLKQILANGYPIIIPAAGKLLNNPNFKNGGPPYHMVVLRGYTPDYFITNDPGTRKGQGYTYSAATILNAAHDWTGDYATVHQGRRVMIVVLPNS